jgi:hypothetical protein
MNEATEDELFSAIEEWMSAKPAPGLEPGTFTTPLFMEKYHMGRTKARRLLAGWVAEDKIKPDRIGYVNAWGWQQHIPGYRFLNGGDKSEDKRNEG